MKDFCPNCEKNSEIEKVKAIEDYDIRGEIIKVPVEYFKCLECGDEFDDPSSDFDPIEIAYKEYRNKHEYIQPDEIKDFRKKYGLTQAEFSKLLGFGGATLSRYENGALQDESHNITLKMAMGAGNLLKLVKGSSNVFSDERKKEIIANIESGTNNFESLENAILAKYGSYEPSELSGFKRFDFEKMKNVILFLCKKGLLTTSINKLLFYADFLHYKKFASSITGIQYAHMDFGPAPEGYDYFLSSLNQNNCIEKKEEIFGDHSGFIYTTKITPDIKDFEDSELLCISYILKYFDGWSTPQIVNFSHQEKAYNATKSGELISYKFADSLQLDIKD